MKLEMLVERKFLMGLDLNPYAFLFNNILPHGLDRATNIKMYIKETEIFKL